MNKSDLTLNKSDLTLNTSYTDQNEVGIVPSFANGLESININLD